jgi:hypothetical protein
MFLNGEPLSTSYLTFSPPMGSDVRGSWRLGGDQIADFNGVIQTSDLVAGVFGKLSLTMNTPDFYYVEITANVMTEDGSTLVGQAELCEDLGCTLRLDGGGAVTFIRQ